MSVFIFLDIFHKNSQFNRNYLTDLLSIVKVELCPGNLNGTSSDLVPPIIALLRHSTGFLTKLQEINPDGNHFVATIMRALYGELDGITYSMT